MHLPNETTTNNVAILSLTWAFLWRFTILYFIVAIIIKVIPYQLYLILQYLSIFIFPVIFMLILWLVIRSVVKQNFGSTQIILMKKVDYQNLVEKVTDDEDLK